MVQRWHFPCHIWSLSCCPAAQLSWTLRATLLPWKSWRTEMWEILTTPEMSPVGSVFKALCLEDQKIGKKKYFGGLINFSSWWNTHKPSLSLLNLVTPFQPVSSWLRSSRRQLSCHYQSRSGGWLCGFRLHSWNICPRWLQGTATCGGGTRNESKLFSSLFPP